MPPKDSQWERQKTSHNNYAHNKGVIFAEMEQCDWQLVNLQPWTTGERNLAWIIIDSYLESKYWAKITSISKCKVVISILILRNVDK